MSYDDAGFCRTRPVAERYGLAATEHKAAKYAVGRKSGRLTADGAAIGNVEVRAL
jgi:hypothetical protein